MISLFDFKWFNIRFFYKVRLIDAMLELYSLEIPMLLLSSVETVMAETETEIMERRG